MTPTSKLPSVNSETENPKTLRIANFDTQKVSKHCYFTRFNVRMYFRLFKYYKKSVWSFRECLETFQSVQNLSRVSGNFPDYPETLNSVQHFPEYPESVLDGPESFQNERKKS